MELIFLTATCKTLCLRFMVKTELITQWFLAKAQQCLQCAKPTFGFLSIPQQSGWDQTGGWEETWQGQPTQVIQKGYSMPYVLLSNKTGGQDLSEALMAQTLPGHEPVGEQWWLPSSFFSSFTKLFFSWATSFSCFCPPSSLCRPCCGRMQERGWWVLCWWPGSTHHIVSPEEMYPASPIHWLCWRSWDWL